MAEFKAWKRILRRINKTLWLEKRKRNQEAVTARIWEALDFARRRQWHPTPVLLPGKSHGWRNLVGCSPCGREESDKTERLPFHFLLSCVGEGNGNPLQCSCLENPRDGETWWVAVYGVAQSRTWLKQLSSSMVDLILVFSYLRRQKTCTQKTIRYWWGKL